MPTESIELSRLLPATPDRIYLAWLNGPDHTAMTGGKATVASTEVGGAFTAWDGYIDGVHVALEPGRRIVQAWRSDDFPADAPESHLEVLLEPAPGGARITIRHTELPEGHGPALLEGWEEHYLVPMERFFSREARRRGEGPAAARKPKAKVRPKAKATRRRAGSRPAARRPTARRAAAPKGRKARSKGPRRR